MKVGLLWYDPDPKKATELKIDEAAARYRERCGGSPNACHVSPDQLTAHPRLHVVGDRWVRPNCFWVGEDEEIAAANAGKAGRARASTARRSA